MSELKTSDGDVLIFIDECGEVSCLAMLRLEEDGILTDDQDFNFSPEELGCVGWLPKLVYEPENK